MLSTDIGIDLGTASILVYIKGKGVVLKEPSVVAFDRDTNKIKAIGEEARLMLGRTPDNIIAVSFIGKEAGKGAAVFRMENHTNFVVFFYVGYSVLNLLTLAATRNTVVDDLGRGERREILLS